VVCIQAFTPAVTVIASKTKPKKLVLLGSDGQEYRYLLKGKEDLHLDERIAQFLRVCNQLLECHPATASRELHARHYAAIPLSKSSGLIQWVDHATPLYHLYRTWHQRTQDEDTPFRPMEAWSSKVKQALEERGLTHLTSRKDWPIEVMQEAFHALQGESPKELIARELWGSSASSGDWWQKVTRFNRSVATMSMVGYILGLGDRHLDNMLVDIRRGEVVHIDMGICFEKGLKLRIPEVVPFRLTQSLEHALGVLGLKGTFRVAAEQVLSALRRNKETLLTLLEAFVYDPLVDWSKQREEDEERRVMASGITISLSCSTKPRCAPAWLSAWGGPWVAPRSGSMPCNRPPGSRRGARRRMRHSRRRPARSRGR
jgi:PI-3-kinase-related kinase SMG-1